MSLGLTLNEPQINLSLVKSPGHLIYEFYNYRLDSEHLMLYREDEEIALTPKQVETLLALVEKNGEIVSKDVLMTRLWGDTVVEEANLIQNIHFLRKQLGDAPDGRPMIETLRRRGYRFTAELNNSCNDEVSLKGSVADANKVEPGYQRRPIAAALAILGIAGLVVIASSSFFSSGSTPSGTRTRFAVLPLKPIDAVNRSDIYEIGVADALIHRLSSIKDFVVRPLSATRKYDAVDQDAVAAGREQKVDRVLASNYQIADGKIRITAQLINVATGVIEDTYRVETNTESIFALQDAVADEIAKKLAARFKTAGLSPAIRSGTNNEEAYRLYLQGKNLTMRRNTEAYQKSIEYFEKAIKLDPSFALAYARMAHAYVGSGVGEKSADIEKAMEFVKKALELDPNLAEAYASRGNIYDVYWDHAAAELDFRRAIELDPNNDTAHWRLALKLSEQGRFDEALSEIDAALAIDPGAVVYMFHRGRILYYGRRYEDAIAQYNHAIDLDDRFIQPHGWMVRVYEAKGDYATAFRYFINREERSPRKDRIDIYRKIYETDGWIGVRRNLAESADLGHFDLARLHASRGEKDAAFENLNKAVEKREWLVATLNVEPAFDKLRDDPQFAALLTQVGLKTSR